MSGHDLIDAINRLPSTTTLRVVQKRNIQIVLPQALDLLTRLSLAHRAVDTSVGEGKRPRSPEKTQDERSVDDVIASARFLADALRESEGQIPGDDLEDALEALQELRD
eukprot:5644631-Prymnesium_polylepis.2